MSPVLRAFLAALLGGTAAWFLRYRFDRGEPARWFFLWLIAVAAAGFFSAVSWWVGDRTVSWSFWIAHAIAVSVSFFLILGFARSFGSKADFRLLFWSIPLMFDLALIIVDGHQLYRQSGATWIPRTDNAFFYVHLGIAIFYILIALYYSLMVYTALQSHGQREELYHFSFILGGLLVIFLSLAVADSLRGTISPTIPVSEIGTILGAVLLLMGIVEPKSSYLAWKKQENA